MMSNINTSTDLFFEGNLVFISVFIICFAFLIQRRKLTVTGFRFFVPFSMPVLLILYSPIVYQLFRLSSDVGDQEFARLWILCPIWMMIPYVIAIGVSRIREKSHQLFTIVTLSVLIVVSGNAFANMDMMKASGSEYKINSVAVEVADEILRLNNGAPTKTLILVPYYEMADNYVEGGTIYRGIEQYTADIDILPVKYTDELWSGSFQAEVTPVGRDSKEYIQAFLTEWYYNFEFEYFAFPTDSVVDSKLSDLGYVRMSDVAGYSIYKMASGL